IKPRRMTPEQLQEGADWASREFYKTSRILGRMFENRKHLLFYLTVATAYKIGHYFHPAGSAPRMHPLDKLDLLAGHGVAPGVPDWMARAAGWEPTPEEPLIVPAGAGKMLPIVQEPPVATVPPAPMV